MKHSLTQDALEKVMHSFITSRLDYGNASLYGLPDIAIKRLQRIQNSAARVLSGTRRFDSISPVLKRLHWLPIRQRVAFKILLITHKVLNDTGPTYLKDLLRPRHTRELRDTNHLYVPRSSTKSYGDRAFSIAAPVLWNSLPPDIRDIDNINSFKRAIKTFFI